MQISESSAERRTRRAQRAQGVMLRRLALTMMCLVVIGAAGCKQAPEGPKAPDSLLKLGMSMAGLDKTQEACATFGKLRKEFSPLKTNIEQALNREVKRLECK